MCPVTWAWEHLTGWWTPGWGNLFTVGVAAAALVVSARHNRRTLQRAEQQFKQNRLDARTDKLRNAIAELLLALGDRTPMEMLYKVKLEEARQTTGSSKPSIQLHQSIIEETIGGVYNRISMHSFAIRMLTNNAKITAPVHRIEQSVARRLEVIRDAAGLGTKGTPVDALKAIQTVASLTSMDELERAIAQDTKLLTKYCLEHFPLERQQ